MSQPVRLKENLPIISAKFQRSLGSVLAFLAIFRQIRDFGPLSGDGNNELAMYRQSPNFRDFEPQNWRYWQNSVKPGDFGKI